MLEAALEEELKDQRLEFDLGLDGRELTLDLVGSNLRFDLEDAFGVLGLLHVVLEALVGRRLLAAATPLLAGRGARGAAGDVAGGSMLRIPILLVALGIERHVCRSEVVLRALRLPRAIDGVGQRIAQPRVDGKTRALRKQAKGGVDVLPGSIRRGE